MNPGRQWQELLVSLRDRNWPVSIKIINDIIDADRENPYLYLKKGDICLKAGDKAEAVNAYMKAAWYLNKDGFLKKALAAYKLALRYDHDNDEALHESNRIMMDLESISEAPRKKEWMIFAPEEPSQDAMPKTDAAPATILYSEKTSAPIIESQTVVPLGFLSYFTSKEIEDIIGRATMKVFSDGKTVVSEGDSGDSVYIIKSGAAHVIGHFFGKVMLLETLSAGDLFGEMAFLTGRTRTASVIAKGNLEVYEIKRSLLEELVEKRPEILSQLSAIYVKRVRDTLKKIQTGKQGR